MANTGEKLSAAMIWMSEIVHVYDTKAKEKIDRFQGTGSFGGCIKCMENPGVYMPFFFNMHYSLFV